MHFRDFDTLIIKAEVAYPIHQLIYRTKQILVLVLTIG